MPPLLFLAVLYTLLEAGAFGFLAIMFARMGRFLLTRLPLFGQRHLGLRAGCHSKAFNTIESATRPMHIASATTSLDRTG